MFLTWKEVPERTKLGECLDVFPRDPGVPTHLDVVAPDVATLRARAFDHFLHKMPATAPCCLYGSLVRMHNPEQDGTLESRARHVTHGEDYRAGKEIIDVEKCRWLPETLTTVLAAAAVLEDNKTGNLVFARQLAGYNIHLVIVRPRPSGFKRDEIGADLITQFLHSLGNRQELFRIKWKRRK